MRKSPASTTETMHARCSLSQPPMELEAGHVTNLGQLAQPPQTPCSGSNCMDPSWQSVKDDRSPIWFPEAPTAIHGGRVPHSLLVEPVSVPSGSRSCCPSSCVEGLNMGDSGERRKSCTACGGNSCCFPPGASGWGRT